MIEGVFIEKIDDVFLNEPKGRIYRAVISVTEKILIEKALRQSEGNQILAAKILGVNRNTLRSKIQRLNIDIARFKG